MYANANANANANVNSKDLMARLLRQEFSAQGPQQAELSPDLPLSKKFCRHLLELKVASQAIDAVPRQLL